jgi:hypothetical protein
MKGPIPRRVGGRFTFERESRRPVVIAERIERIPGLPAVCGPIPDDRRDDFVKAGLTSRHQIARCQAFPGFCAPSGKQRQILRRGRLGAIVAAAAHEHPRPDNAGDHGMLCLIGGGAVQDAVTDVTAGLIEGHHDGTVTQVTDIQGWPTRCVSSFHYFISLLHSRMK